MKANELMAGDWVYDEMLKAFGKVEVVTPFAIQCDIHTDTHHMDFFKPIPLTEEILKANGWEEKFEKARYSNVFYGLEHGRICISYEVDNGLPILTIEDTCDRSKEHNVICLKDEIYNVHELQHALRLCGLNDLADNFKLTND